MSQRLSRRKIAAYYADELLAGNSSVLAQLASYLVDARRVREYELIVRDIELALAGRGVLVADVTSSRELLPDGRKSIEAFLKLKTQATTTHLRSSVDPSLLGGVKIAVPGSELDATLRRKLTLLKATKI